MTLTPSLTFSENNAGGGIAAILGMIPALRDWAGVASGVKFKEAQVVLLLTDNETTEQLAAATGAARATDLGVGGIVIGKVLGGAAGWGLPTKARSLLRLSLMPTTSWWCKPARWGQRARRL